MRIRTPIYSLVVLILAASVSWSGSTLHIGFGAGSPCATGCGGDPNLATPIASGGSPANRFDIYQTSNGALNAVDPILLILGVPLVGGASAKLDLFSNSTITSLTSVNPYPGGEITGSPPNSWDFGNLKADHDTLAFSIPTGKAGYVGDFTAAAAKDVYKFIGLKGANDSNNWTNWHGSNLAINGIDADAFAIYLFSLHATFGPNGLLDLTTPDVTTIPNGTYLIAYGLGTDGKKFSTAFTEAGLQDGNPTPIPEPTSLLLLGTGLLGLGKFYRKRKAGSFKAHHKLKS